MTSIIYLALFIAILVGMWKAFIKMGRAGWEGLVPFYNLYILILIVGKPAWWIVLFLIPVVDLYIAWVVFGEIAKRFGKGAGFTVGLIILGFVFWPILGFGDAKYSGPSAATIDTGIKV